MNRFPLFPDQNYSYTQRFTVKHRGIDILAPRRSPVLAVDDGKAWRQNDSKGGKVAYLQTGSLVRGDLTTYYYAHLDDWFPVLGIAPDYDHAVDVRAGDVLGYVGTTGNAAGGPPHLHFQVRQGSLVVDPFPELQAVDPHPERGHAGSTVRAPATPWPAIFGIPDFRGPLALFALIWLFRKAK